MLQLCLDDLPLFVGKTVHSYTLHILHDQVGGIVVL